ncbi:DnaJ family domain-containing protein [Thiohalorhabdus sp. Cl-TMA]|uniref:DnaJ family domain-containing protein n=1 Tax=Thiohalorhabdus methylotrophus TaxID=3242694 RepID=A0ABV4TT62_9GAMM
MVFLFQRLAEERIQEAMEEGVFDDLPGEGEPLELEDDSMVPEELRTAYRMLKNSGHLPPELAPNQEIKQLEDLLEVVEDPAEASKARARLRVLAERVRLGRGRSTSLKTEQIYKEKLLRRFASDGE